MPSWKQSVPSPQENTSGAEVWGSGRPALSSYGEGHELAHPSGLPGRAGILLPAHKQGRDSPPGEGSGLGARAQRGPFTCPKPHSALSGAVLGLRHLVPPTPPPETENRRSLPSLTPRHPAPTHIPRSHPGCQPSCSTAQTSGHSARGVPMPGAPARPACCLLHCLQKCRRKGTCPGQVAGPRPKSLLPLPPPALGQGAGGRERDALHRDEVRERERETERRRQVEGEVGLAPFLPLWGRGASIPGTSFLCVCC